MTAIRPITARWTVTATLEMMSASQIGSQGSDNADSTFEQDAGGAMVLRGTTLAGALRSALADRLLGYRAEEPTQNSEIAKLFGSATTRESALIVFDAVSEDSPRPRIRDGVRLHPVTGLAVDKHKYDRELNGPGLSFPIRLDLIVPSAQEEGPLLRLLVDALAGMERDAAPPCGGAAAAYPSVGAIRLGARRSRGLGACRARDFRARRYDLASPQGWLDYAASDPCDPFHGRSSPSLATAVDAISAENGTPSPNAPDKRCRLHLDFDLIVQGTLLIRAPGQTASSADVAHLAEDGQPLLSGQSLGGALRARAHRIVRTLGLPDGDRRVNVLFGKSPEEARRDKQPTGSRVFVGEAIISDSRSFRQTRTKIDRFTGGTVNGALFDEEPCVGGHVRITVEARAPQPADIGLLLLVARDLVEGLLPLGGEASIGRGVVRGRVTASLPGNEGCLILETDAEGTAQIREKTIEDVQRLYLNPLLEGTTP